MLENSELLEGINQPQVLAKMIQELPWSNLKAYVQANAPLLKSCTIGGHRLDPKRRDRVEKLVIREAEKAEYSQTFCSGIFAVWYPVHEELHKILEDYFHSDEYKTYREEKELGEEEYVLPDEKFSVFFKLDDLEKWRALLCFSPLKFTDDQASKILDDSQGNAELLERIRQLGENIEGLEKRHSQMEGENERLKEKQREGAAETQESRKALRALKTENEGLEKKLEVSLAELKKLRQVVEEAEQEKARQSQNLKTELKKHGSRLQGDLNRVQKELADWKGKYEEQRVENRQLAEAIEEANRRLEEARADRAKVIAEQKEMDSFAGLVLEHIDWSKVGAQMKLTPTMRRQFNSLIRKLNYEDDNTLTIEGTLPDFWDGLLALEKQLIQSIAESNTREVMRGGIEEYWMALSDAFDDVKISLEARIILLVMLQEIFYQVLDSGDLRKPEIPRATARKEE